MRLDVVYTGNYFKCLGKSSIISKEHWTFEKKRRKIIYFFLFWCGGSQN